MSTDKSNLGDSHRSLMKFTSIISLGTLSSRILGFFRDIILAKLLGTGMRADAFFVAFKIPNLFRDLVGDGATNAAVVPVLSEYQHKNDKIAFWKFVSVVYTLAMIILSVITLLGIFLAPWIVKIMAPGFIEEPEKFELTVKLTKWLYPYLILIGLTAYSMGVLYTFRSFVIPAFSPCLLNVAMIVGAFISFSTMEEPIYGLAISVLVGGVLQLVVQIKPLFDKGMRLERPETLNHPGAVKIGKLLLPRILGSGIYQISVLIDTFCASLSSIVGPGGISAIYYSNRIIQFPMGVFSVAIASALLPTLSRFSSKDDMVSFKRTILFSLENIFFIMCPTIVVLLLLAQPIVRVLFQRGEFDVYSTDITSWALSFYAIGLMSFGGIKILVSAFYALQDTRTPVKVAAICVLINAILNFLLMPHLKVGGIALASSIAATVDFLALLYFLDKRLGGLDKSIIKYMGKVIFAAVIVGVIEFTLWHVWVFNNETIKLIVVGIVGFVLYECVCLILKVEQAQKIWDWLLALKNSSRILN